MAFIYFIYGLGFFSLGITILVYPKKESGFNLAKTIVFIGIFGILHGMHEWYDMLALLWTPPQHIRPYLETTDLALASISFLSLIIFGVKTLSLGRRPHPALTGLPYLLYLAWMTAVYLTDAATGVIWARYLLAVPGTFLTAYALFAESERFIDERMTYTAIMLHLASINFIAYGVLSGLVVSPAAFFPASLINTKTFLDLTGVPVQLFRTACAIGIAFTIASVLKVFEIETARKIDRHTRELEEANRMKGLFGDIMSHDLSNSIHNIRFASEVLLETMEKGDKKTEIIESIHGSAETMKAMIRSASILSKLETIKKLDFKKEDLGAVLCGIATDFGGRVEEKGQRLICHEKKGYPVAEVNFTIRDVFINLVSNAIKYSPCGREIEIGIEDADERIIVYVKDRGEGVPDRYKENIFERFERGGKEGVQGYGLGLAITKRIVELHSGRVWVEDNPGGGSIFKVSLPKRHGESKA